MFKKPSVQELVTLSMMLLWIFIINIVTPRIIKAPTWPMFFVTIFFFIFKGDKTQLLSIFLSGFVGICSAYILVFLINILNPILGVDLAIAAALFIILGLIIIGGGFCPLIFNNITFAYLTVCAIDVRIIESNFLSWTLMLVIGGMIIVSGAILIEILIEKVFKNQKL